MKRVLCEWNCLCKKQWWVGELELYLFCLRLNFFFLNYNCMKEQTKIHIKTLSTIFMFPPWQKKRKNFKEKKFLNAHEILYAWVSSHALLIRLSVFKKTFFYTSILYETPYDQNVCIYSIQPNNFIDYEFQFQKVYFVFMKCVSELKRK